MCNLLSLVSLLSYSSSYDEDIFAATVLATAMIIYLVMLVVYVIVAIGWWKLFTKAGEPGWAAIIPFYNLYILCKISWGNGWLFLVNFAAVIPFVGWIAALIFRIMTQVKVAKSFGKGTGFVFGLFFLPYIFYPILGFGNAQYYGVSDGNGGFYNPNQPMGYYNAQGQPMGYNGYPQQGQPMNYGGNYPQQNNFQNQGYPYPQAQQPQQPQNMNQGFPQPQQPQNMNQGFPQQPVDQGLSQSVNENGFPQSQPSNPEGYSQTQPNQPEEQNYSEEQRELDKRNPEDF